MQEKHFEDTCIGGPEHSGKVYWSKNKGLSPGAQCLIHEQVAQLPPTVEEVQPLELQAHTHACQEGLCLIFPSAHLLPRLHLGCKWCCTWAMWLTAVEREHANEGTPRTPLLSSDYIILGLGRGKLSFKLTSHFPYPLSNSILFLDFPRLDSTSV